MAAKESFRERQTHELEAIKSIFNSDVEDLNPINTASPSRWKPINIRIELTPLRDSTNGLAEIYVKTKLHVVCNSKYPKVPPKIFLEETKGISDQLIDELLQALQKQTNKLRGEEMIYELAHTVQTFLSKHNKRPRGSFYDEMLQQKQQREQELLDLKKQRENMERQHFLDEVERRKEMFKSENKRREPLRSMSESNRHATSSESSESSSPFYRGHIYPSKCMEHRDSETLYFHKVGRQIRRGCCMGHSQKGCIAYTGIDLDSGQLLYITEWNIKYSQIDQHCGNGTGKCSWLSSEHKCSGNHRVDEVISSIEKRVANLSLLNHENLIQYECVLCVKRKEGLLVYLVQDFVLGTSVFSISSSLGWCMDGVRRVAKGVIEALAFLHKAGVTHSHLLDSNVFMDNTGTIRVTDFSLVPNLLELIGGSGQKSTQGDLPALGALVESLMTTPPIELKDFVEKCKSDRTLSASELLEHPFLRSSLFTADDIENQLLNLALTNNQYKPSTAVPPLKQKQKALAIPQTPQTVAPLGIPSLPASQSRLGTEFEVLAYLGKGAFGDVLEVRNILDNRQYAIKRIPLPARSRQLYKKMTREVELLSRLNHENVVRYFNSWIENCSDEDMKHMDELISGDWSVSRQDSSKRPKTPQGAIDCDETETDSSSAWKGYVPHMDDSDSDGIEFVDSKGEVAVYSEDDDDGELELSSKANSPKPLIQVMYIQMEFCEKCTLRTAIDNNLYQDSNRLWRLFREIAEGLSHIHQQGIIHRDLKPVNIFLDSHDQIKIGDFGLATTSFLALQANGEHHNPNSQITLTEDGTGTGKVGTALYVAPELTGSASKSIYNQKVDMYTLGIILFEMCNPPFGTSMERAETIVRLRSSNIIFPDTMLTNKKSEKTVELIRWLLNHDAAKRPTALELLASDLVPPAELEASELQEMLKNALANPQSKAYKHIVQRCLQQENDNILEHTYHIGSNRAMKSWNTPIVLDNLVTFSPLIELVKGKIVSLFRKHGAIEVDTPLLSPFTKHNANNYVNQVRLMTHSGCVVVLPSDLRTEFARHVAMSGVNMIRRYCVDRVYREEKVFNFHPKQSYNCAFDIISPHSASHLVDAELLYLAYEIALEIPNRHEKNIMIRLNHTNLLRAILLHCNVPKDMYSDLFGSILDHIEGRISKFQFSSSVNAIMEKTKTSATSLIDLLMANFQVSGKNSADDSPLKNLLRGKGEAASLAKGALREMESIVLLAQSLGVKCPIHIFACLPIGFEKATSGGIVWHMTADLKPNRTSRPSVIAIGERYDSMLMEFQKQAQGFNPNLPNRGISGAGLSFSLDKLVATMFSENFQQFRTIDVGVCVSGSRPPLTDITYIMRVLWAAGIRSSFLETITSSGDEAQDLAKLGAMHVILVAENGALRIRSWDRERFQERHVTLTELVDFIQKMPRSTEVALNASIDVAYPQTSTNYYSNSYSSSGTVGSYGSNRSDYGLSTSASGTSIKNSLSNLPSTQVQFLLHDKMTANYRRRLENQVTQQMSSTLAQFVRNESIVVLVVEVDRSTLNAIVGAINPRGTINKETEEEIIGVIGGLAKHRRYVSEILEEVSDYIQDDKVTIVALYSTTESYYRFII